MTNTEHTSINIWFKRRSGFMVLGHCRGLIVPDQDRVIFTESTDCIFYNSSVVQENERTILVFSLWYLVYET